MTSTRLSIEGASGFHVCIFRIGWGVVARSEVVGESRRVGDIYELAAYEGDFVKVSRVCASHS